MHFNFNTSAAFVSLLVLVAIIISGLHIKDVLALNDQAKLNDAATKKVVGDNPLQATSQKTDTDHANKVSAELHTHVDKQIVKTFLKAGMDHPIDSRSLKQLERAREFYESVRPLSVWEFLGFYLAAKVWA